jgi:predicted alpha/beta-fold hydrolase
MTSKLPKYRPPFLLRNAHLATIVPNLFRKSTFQYSQRSRITTDDGDFLLVDSYPQNSDEVLVLLHGLEGSSMRPYIRNLAQVAVGMGLDVIALNFRSCGGEMNLNARFYHSGETSDLDFLLNHLKAEKKYRNAYMAGFSLGGNVLLKYLGEQGEQVKEFVKGAMAISVPVDLATSAKEIEKFSNSHYLKRFLKSLKEKVRSKMHTFPDAADWKGGLKATGFYDFDDAVTAPLHGFDGVMDYYTQASSLPLLHKIKVPTLLLNARNDSFLSESCYPQLKESDFFHPLYPDFGGHVGFARLPLNRSGFVEEVFVEFLDRLR